MLMSHNNVPLSVPGKGMLIPISLGNSNCLGFRADAAFTKTSIGLVSSDELSCFLNRFSLPDGSAASLFARKRPLHVDAGGAKSTHTNFNDIVYTIQQPQMIQHKKSHKYITVTIIRCVLNSKYCQGWKGFKLIVPLNSLKTIQRRQASAMWRFTCLYCAMRAAIKG